jgi:hypothetical protein
VVAGIGLLVLAVLLWSLRDAAPLWMAKSMAATVELATTSERDLPRRQTGPAGQEGEVVVAADRQQHRWLDLDRPEAPADVASVPGLGAAESGRRETAIAKTLSGLAIKCLKQAEPWAS